MTRPAVSRTMRNDPHPGPLPQEGEGARLTALPLPHPGPLPQEGEGARLTALPLPHPGPLPQEGEGARLTALPLDERGFTLLELVLALSILAAMLVILFGGLRVGLRAWQRGDARAETLQHERSLAQLLEQTLGGTQAYMGVAPGGQGATTAPAGATGAAGATGPGGASAGTGQAGTTGPAGATGAQGSTGSTGARGLRQSGQPGGLSPQGGLSPTGAGPSAPASTVAQQPQVLLFQGEASRVSFVTVTPPLPLRIPVAYTAVTLSMETTPVPGLAIRVKALPNTDPFEEVAPLLVDPTITAVRFRYLREPDRNWEEQWNAEDERTVPSAIEVTLTTTVAGASREHPPLTVPIRATAP